ncbi:DUF4843 domain-containing protein [Prevotella sp.]|uniref:DUF4843 domain-containing protein n=1 Tax=Prevotella sp. TaxID=59823 RepID=UPI002F9407F9
MKINLVMENKLIRYHAHRLERLLILLSACMLLSCSEDRLNEYDTSRTALNIAKGTIFGSASLYPEEYTFNAYFLGGDIHDYLLHIPVRLQGVIDNNRDRTYKVKVVTSESTGLTEGLYTLAEEQVFRKGMAQDSIRLTIHINRMDEEQNYKMRIALVPTADFQAGIAEYQYMDISFTKNLSIAPAFWENNSKLRRLPYNARKCAVFLQISGITDPNWKDDGQSVILEYWITRCIQWFEEHEEYDATGNRIYFDQ